MNATLPGILFATLAVFYSHHLSSLAATVITPAEVVRLTLAHSPALKEHDEEIHSADARLRQADAGLMPRLDAQAQASHYNQLENRPLAPTVNIPVFEDQYSAFIGITQPLYTGGRVTRQKEAARLDREGAFQTRQAGSANLTLLALSTYWNWSKITSQITAYQTALSRMEALVTDTRNLKQAGLATDSDLLSAEVLLEQARLQLDESHRLADISRIRLTQLTGQSFTTNEIPQAPSITGPASTPTLAAALGQALTNRPELASLQLNAQAALALAEASQADFRPQVALIARYEQGNPNNRDFPPDNEWKDDTVIAATVSWNLFDGGITRARVAEARSQAARRQLELQVRQEAILAEVQEALLNLSHAAATLQTSSRAEASAKRNLEVAADLWKNGAARHADVLDAQTRLTASTAQRIAAEADILINRIILSHAMGCSLTPSP